MIDTRLPGCILDLKNSSSIAKLLLLEQCHPFLWVFGNHCSTLCLYELVYTSAALGFPGGLAVKNLPASAGGAGDPGSILGSGRSLGEGNGNPLQNSCLKNSMDRGAWRVKVHGITKNWTWPSIQHIHTHTVWVTSFNQLKIWTEWKGWVRGDSFCFTVWAGCGSFPTFGLNWKVNFSWVLNLLAFRLELLPPAFLGL